MPVQKLLEGIQGDVRFHHITPELWVMEARRCAHRWVVFHETYSFCLVRRIDYSATVRWKYNHRLYDADTEHAMMMQPGEVHANVDRTPPGDFVVWQVAESLMKRVARALGWRHAELNIRHPHPGSDHPVLLRALGRFHRELCDDLFDGPNGAGGCTCWQRADRHLEHLAGLVAVFIEHCAEKAREVVCPEQGAAPITRALDYLRAHYDQPYNLAALANAVGCDRFYLARMFTREMGIRPSEFHNRILVAKACAALAASPEKPLDVVAAEIGWPGRSGPNATDDASKATLMIRHFRRALGVTPGEFRASLRAMSTGERRRYLTPALGVHWPRDRKHEPR